MRFLLGLGLSCASCLTIRVGGPGQVGNAAPSQAVETDVEKVRRSLADLRTIGTILQEYFVNTNQNPKTDASAIFIGEFRFAPVDRLSSLPAGYRSSLPTFDPWGFPYLYGSDGRHWALICTGSDGRLEDADLVARLLLAAVSSQWRQRPQQTHCFEDEIVVMDAHFLTWPANDTRMCGAARLQTAPDPTSPAR
jgi:hypothetical protein